MKLYEVWVPWWSVISYSSVPLSVYSPEIVQNFPYGEKADIWALGCILYQMCTLQAPFFSDNMLVLVNKVTTVHHTKHWLWDMYKYNKIPTMCHTK